jgi:uncharacterized membrane protein
MTRRRRYETYGSAVVVAIIGGIVGALASSLVLQAVGWSLFGLALGAIVLLVFLEIGLSEDRAREEEEKGR